MSHARRHQPCDLRLRSRDPPPPSRPQGSKLEKLCDACAITLNKNAVHGDKNAAAPGGVRLGTPALTSRGFGAADFEQVAELLHEAVGLALAVQERSGPKLAAFEQELKGEPGVAALRERVQALARGFPMP